MKSITVSGVYGQGDYDLSTGKWKFGANDPSSTYVIEPKDASVKAGEIKPLTDKTSALMMIPQDFGPDAKAKVSMVFNDGAKDKTVSFSLKGSWEAGKHITYVLSSSKITTLKMGDLTYPDGWNSVNINADATKQIRTAYDDPNSSVDAGLFVVNEDKTVIDANVQLTYDGTSWSLKGSKLKFSPQYNYFVYYPYQERGLSGAPAKDASDIDVTSAEKFFANAIDYWKSHKITADQSTPDKMNACDLQIGKASLEEDGCSVSFKMEHAMGLAEIVLDKNSFTNSICYLVGYDEYPTWNGTTTSYASSSIKNHTMYGIADHRYVSIVKPGENSFMSATDKDAWEEEVKLSPAANEVKSGTAYNSDNTTTPHAYTLAVGDIYYSDGAISHQEDDLISTSERIPIGIVGYTTMKRDGNYWTEKDVVISGKPVGGHALVMCLKTIGSTGSTKAAQDDYNKYRNNSRPIVQAYIGTIYRWYSDCYTDAGLDKVTSKPDIVNSKNQTSGSGYTETAALIRNWGSAAAAAYQAKNYSTLPAPSSKCTGWFLPSAGQYYAAMSQLGGGMSSGWAFGTFFSNMKDVTTKINDKLKKVGDSNYTEFFGDINTWAWTSSEYSSKDAVGIDSGVDDSKGSGSVRFNTILDGKTNWFPVRPFLAF